MLRTLTQKSSSTKVNVLITLNQWPHWVYSINSLIFKWLDFTFSLGNDKIHCLDIFPINLFAISMVIDNSHSYKSNTNLRFSSLVKETCSGHKLYDHDNCSSAWQMEVLTKYSFTERVVLTNETQLLFLKEFIYLFSEREEGREKRGREISMWKSICCLSHAPQLRTEPVTQLLFLELSVFGKDLC